MCSTVCLNCLPQIYVYIFSQFLFLSHITRLTVTNIILHCMYLLQCIHCVHIAFYSCYYNIVHSATSTVNLGSKRMQTLVLQNR